jgi:signal transduction histidine kinase/DNA-binding response OmpR family regulator
MTSEYIVTALLEAEGYAVFEYLGDAAFQVIGNPPRFCAEILGNSLAFGAPIRLAEVMPFLESFLPDAEECWGSKSEKRVDSGLWIEKAIGGREVPLEASALCLAGKQILLIQNPQARYEEETRVFQKARESALSHEHLLREIQKKEIILHCVIHDLSQPLAAMRGCFSLLAAENLSLKDRGIVEIGQRQSQNQEELIRGVLDAFSAELTSHEAAHRDPAAAPDLAKCAQEVATDFSAAFAAKSARIEFAPQVDRTPGWRVVGDESRLRRIYTNLVENALRYSPTGSVVTLGVVADGNYLIAYVDDEGPGLPEGASKQNLFGLFTKGKDGGGKVGLGLYFCKITVERWGGTIGCENRPRRGTRFWFRLPQAAPPAAANRAEEDSLKVSKTGFHKPGREETNGRSEPLRLLLADDSRANRQITVLLLQKFGHAVVAVESGRDALSRMEAESFDAVILDEEMPIMGGFEAARAIRKKEKSTGTHIPIVVVSGNATESARRRGAEAGADAHLAKPFREEELVQIIQNLHDGVHPATHAWHGDAHVEETFSATGLLARVGGNPQVLRDLARISIEDTPKRMSAIRKAIAKKDGAALARAAHALRGSVAMMGAKEVAEECRKIEHLGRSGNLERAGEVLPSFAAKLSHFESVLRGLSFGKRKLKTRNRATGGARNPRSR